VDDGFGSVRGRWSSLRFHLGKALVLALSRKSHQKWHFSQIMFGVLLGMEASKKPFSHTHTKYIPLLEKWNLILRIKIVILRTLQLEAIISTEFI
jgi:hypothetical protein